MNDLNNQLTAAKKEAADNKANADAKDKQLQQAQDEVSSTRSKADSIVSKHQNNDNQ
ncbi:hypothetical protein [Lacticaseibacillus sharpeae]|uniref:Uncharacterized protein n=1 Tax=Lacticaseibacillus sharpeae JCM 1186 = DSM 20505 TaxID=1291052 RepID=A0A0R1ZK11_9LACO|nr:hypothetical protein [Lacticaseibacillus sharpeae]KRM55288.1 hypothetical protein FC18_GL001450 [Lacticaseibacillus sharpeae JCM 1186 = DSM 20505]